MNMRSASHSPILAAGILLLVLGTGNWLVSRDKINEFVRRVRTEPPIEATAHLEQFPELTHRTNATLLARLHRGLGEYSFLAAKIDFYEIMESGGRLLALLGVLMVAVFAVRNWRFRRAVVTPPIHQRDPT